MQTGDRTVYKVAQKWEECLSGPEMARRDVHARRKYAPESASRSERGIWDAVSAKDRKRKAHPILTPDSGSRFPKRPQSGKRIPL